MKSNKPHVVVLSAGFVYACKKMEIDLENRQVTLFDCRCCARWDIDVGLVSLLDGPDASDSIVLQPYIPIITVAFHSYLHSFAVSPEGWEKHLAP